MPEPKFEVAGADEADVDGAAGGVVEWPFVGRAGSTSTRARFFAGSPGERADEGPATGGDGCAGSFKSSASASSSESW